MKRFALLIVGFAFLFASCQEDDNEASVTSIEFYKSKLSLKVGEVQKPDILHSPADLPAPEYFWESSDEKIAIVNGDGSISALAEGSATIMVNARDGKLSATTIVSVEPVEANGIALSSNSVSVVLGDTVHLNYAIEPDTTTNKEVVWSSDDPSIAEVTDGVIKAKKTGTTVVRVTLPGSDVDAACTVEVLPVEVSSITLNQERLELLPGEESKLSYSIEPDSASNPRLTWKSDNPDVAVVEDGNVTAVAPGNAIITLEEEGSDVSASCEVEVKPISVTGISLSQTELTLEVERSVQLSATISPRDATNTNTTWQVADPAIASVNENGKINGISEGTTTITVMAEDGGYSAACDVEVIPVRARGVELNITEAKMLAGDTISLNATVKPTDAANKDVTWSSRNPDVAEVSPEGLVTSVSEGTAYIEVKTQEGGHSALCRVDVVLMDDMMDLFFLDYALTSINGYLTGEFRFGIMNKSLYDVLLTELYIYEGDTGKLMSYTTDPAKLGILEGDTSSGISLSINVNSVYRPIVKWVFEYEGETYSVQHQYE